MTKKRQEHWCFLVILKASLMLWKKFFNDETKKAGMVLNKFYTDNTKNVPQC